MKKTLMSIIIVGLAFILHPVTALAVVGVPDQFIGDTAIYGGQPSTLQPNVLIIIDDSGSMKDPADATATGSPYAPATWSDPLPPATAPNAYPQVAQCYSSAGPYNLCWPTTVYNNSAGNTVLTDVTLLPPAGCTYSTSTTSHHTTTYTTITTNPYNSLTTTGIYSGYALNADGSCKYCNVTINGTVYTNGICAGANVTYQLGNYINWSYGNPSSSATKISIARDVIGTLIQSTHAVRFGVMTYNYAQTSNGLGGTFLSYPISGSSTNYVTTVKNMDNAFGTATNREALVQALNSLTPQGSTPLGEALYEAMSYYQGAAPPFGATIGVTNGVYKSPIQYSCQKNYVVVITDGMANTDTSNLIPQYLYDTPYTAGTKAGARYDGGCTNTSSYTYTTCNATSGSYDGATNENHCLAGIAQYMYTHDQLSKLATTSQNNVTVFTIGFGTDAATTEAVDLLNLAADSNHGNGAYFAATSAQTLGQALTKIVNTIYATNTSYVAPVVPVNPENKLQFGSRVYMGFFYPEQNAFWDGNLKKFGLGCAPGSVDPGCSVANNTPGNFGFFNVIDVNGNLATYVDANGDGIDDRDGALLCSTCSDGSFRSTAVSYWTTPANTPATGSITTAGEDGGIVEAGGVGAVLETRPYAIASVTSAITGSVRHIYTYMGQNTDLTNSTNAFSTANALITATSLSLPGNIITSGTTTDVKQLINYVHGFDVYSANANTNKRAWIVGDDLHSKPLVVSYASYTYSDESNCAKNKNIIYAGTNDGMLHAFYDCSGIEAWAFIPPDLLPYLQYLTGTNHTYYVDSSPQVFTYLANPNDATTGISSANNDSVILLVGLRRGGGVTTEPGQGFYYALDVTNPATPKYLWTISPATAGFSDLGEAWSEPKIGQIVVGSQIKAAAFLGGGYDNCNEDGRFGATQTFSGSCVGVLATEDSGLDSSGNPLTSAGLVTAATFSTSNSYKGRSVYVVELATVPATSGSALNMSTTGSKIWSYTFANSNPLQYSMLSEIAAVDLSGDGYVDHLYMGDSGGNIWRFNLSSTKTANWTVTKIFSSNPGYTNGVLDGSTGRKIFYRPAVVPDLNNQIVRLYFGTGDREHPLNRAVVDRIYALFDKGTNSSGQITGITTAVTEANMVDVTSDALQSATTVAAANTALSPLNLASLPTDTTEYGWYIRLDSGDRTPQVLCNGNPCPGEKVLSTAAVAAGTVFMTTYSPVTASTATTNPCTGGNLGTSYVYALDYLTGDAVVNYDTSNDSTSSTYASNLYAFAPQAWASGQKTQVLLRTDRHRTVGSGIPSSPVVICSAGNTNCITLIGCGGGLCTSSAPQSPGASVSPVYWRQR